MKITEQQKTLLGQVFNYDNKGMLLKDSSNGKIFIFLESYINEIAGIIFDLYNSNINEFTDIQIINIIRDNIW